MTQYQFNSHGRVREVADDETRLPWWLFPSPVVDLGKIDFWEFLVKLILALKIPYLLCFKDSSAPTNTTHTYDHGFGKEESRRRRWSSQTIQE